MTPDELIALRERLHWSQAEAARQLGCSQRSIINWEQGKSQIPKSIALAVAAVLFDLPPYGTHKSDTIYFVSTYNKDESPPRFRVSQVVTTDRLISVVDLELKGGKCVVITG